jgi:hypothetical protein
MKVTWRLAKRGLGVSVFILVIICFTLYFFAPSTQDRFRAAEKKAHAFCDSIEIGTDISNVVAKAKAEGIFGGPEQGYTFYFPATGFDKAVCDVTVDRQQKVAAKSVEMQYD